MIINKRIITFFTLFLNLTGFLTAFKKVCYFTNWAQSRPSGGEFYPEDINPSLCTHIIYAFAKIENYNLSHTEQSDIGIDNGPGLYERIMVLKMLNPSLKIMLAVGGWTQGSTGFEKVVESDETMEKFAKNSVDYLKKWNFDGLDVDWEFPYVKKSEFTKLLEELRITFDTENEKTKSHLELSIAVSAVQSVIDSSYEIEMISQYVDFVNLMAYDYHGIWSNKTGFHSALYPKIGDISKENTLNAEWSVKYWLDKGCPKEKLILGIAFYGRGFKLANPELSELGAPSRGSSKAGFYTNEAGFLSYFEICQIIKENNLIESYNSELGVPNIVYGSEWIGYENQESVIQKANYIKDNCLGGAMVWTVDFDDFKGKFCDQGDYPLLKILNEVLQGTDCIATTQATPPVTYTSPYKTTQLISSTSNPISNKCDGNSLIKSIEGCEFFQVCLEGFLNPLATVKCPENFWFGFSEQTCVVNKPKYCDQIQTNTTSIPPTKTTEKTSKTTIKTTTKTSTEITTKKAAEKSTPKRKLTSPNTYEPTYETNEYTETTFFSTSTSPIDFNSDFVCPEMSGIFPDYQNCRQFWHCSNNIAYVKQCPGDLVFDSKLKICSWTSDICRKSLINVIFPQSFDFDTTSKLMIAEFKCPQPNGIFAHESNCKSFWHCSNNIPVLKTCAGNLLFNNKIGVCDYKSSCTERSI